MWPGLILLLIAIAVFRLSYFILRIAARRNETAEVWLRRFPFIEFLVWIPLSFRVINSFFAESDFFYPIVIILIIILLTLFSWFFLRDFFAGLIVRSDTALRTGRYIESENFAGKLDRLSTLNLQLITEGGEIVKIPYHRLSSEKITFPDPDGNFRAYTFRLKSDINISPAEAADHLRKTALCSAWSSACHEPLVRKIGSDLRENHYEVTVYALTEIHAERTAESLKNCFA